MPLPKKVKSSLPPLDSLIDTEESIIELTDEDFDNEVIEEEFEEIEPIIEEDEEDYYDPQKELENESFYDEEDYYEEQPKSKKGVIKTKKSKLSIKMIITFSIVFVLIGTLLFVVPLFFGNSSSENKTEKIDKPTENISLSVENNIPYAKVILDKDSSGKVQALYDDKEFILCESIIEDFGTEEKEIELACSNDEIDLKNLKNYTIKFVKE